MLRDSNFNFFVDILKKMSLFSQNIACGQKVLPDMSSILIGQKCIKIAKIVHLTGFSGFSKRTGFCQKSFVFSLVFFPLGEIVIAKCEAVTAEYKRANYAHAHNKGVKK